MENNADIKLWKPKGNTWQKDLIDSKGNAGLSIIHVQKKGQKGHEHAISNCRCGGPVVHDIDSLKKGHGSRCANGHCWTYRTANGECLMLDAEKRIDESVDFNELIARIDALPHDFKNEYLFGDCAEFARTAALLDDRIEIVAIVGGNPKCICHYMLKHDGKYFDANGVIDDVMSYIKKYYGCTEIEAVDKVTGITVNGLKLGGNHEGWWRTDDRLQDYLSKGTHYGKWPETHYEVNESLSDILQYFDRGDWSKVDITEKLRAKQVPCDTFLTFVNSPGFLVRS